VGALRLHADAARSRLADQRRTRSADATRSASSAEVGKLKGRKLVYASQGATLLDLVPILAFGIKGLKVRRVFGSRGLGEGRLALEPARQRARGQPPSAPPSSAGCSERWC
jgi:hypothetical protein